MHFDWLSIGGLIATAHILGVIAACHAILNTRTSQGAIAWAALLIAMPYFTLIPYLFLGRSKFSGYVDARRLETEWFRTHKHPRTWDTRASSTSHPADAFGHATVRALIHLSGMPFLRGNSVRTLVNGDATFSAIFDAIEQAQHYVLVQFFIVRDDALGKQLSDLLIAKAAQGIRVYFLYDSIGSIDLHQQYVDTLRAGHVQIHPFATKRYFVNRFQLNFRNHRKIVVVDGKQAFVGGHNVGVEYLGANPRLSPWRDTHIEIRGPVISSVQFIFIEDWYWATQQLPQFESAPSASPTTITTDDEASPAAPERDMHCLVIAPGPADKQETGSLFFVQAINAASERIWITTPYLVPDEAVFSALRLAVMRGVDVRLLIPCRRDHYVVFEASTLYAYDLINAGVRIFRYQPGFLHQKVVLIDKTAAAVGSANLDNRSFRLNFEIIVLTIDRAFAAEVESMLMTDFQQAREVNRNEYRHAPAWRRVIMHIARLFSPIL